MLAEAAHELYRHPVHAGLPEGAVVGEGGRVADGRLVRIGLCAADGRIEQAGFLAFGCPSTIAAAAWAARWLQGQSLVEAGQLRGLAIAEALELSADKLSVALVVEDALRAALAGLEHRQESL